ncbi:MAG TPA: NfeD family protein [Bacteroidales bacterium]|nr:NfeD family protein [Bacteroidales bacterium]
MFARPELFWFFIGLILLLAELVIPGFFILFFGLGAWITALVCLIWEPSVNLQMVIFGITSILALAGLRRLIQKKLFYNKDDSTHDIEDEFTGREAVAENNFGKEKVGRVFFKGTSWHAESAGEIREGDRVIIREKHNFKLIVEPKFK